MTKRTTAQAAKALGITKAHLHSLLYDYPHLRPREQAGPLNQLWWSDEEINQLRTHLATHPFRQTQWRTARHQALLNVEAQTAESG